ncbi:hypothetical protein EVAR_97704_1 [Eumeta japonica]|uniref:Uncharacterized protein n=1 Tax=Eumeta variegata TaxID=151549 RepID=A0A4C1XZC2_EUMVA|nr:hypothetical protein EVAR_97704_1 [Eumeta japonica]
MTSLRLPFCPRGHRMNSLTFCVIDHAVNHNPESGPAHDIYPSLGLDPESDKIIPGSETGLGGIAPLRLQNLKQARLVMSGGLWIHQCDPESCQCGSFEMKPTHIKLHETNEKRMQNFDY